MTVKIGDVVRLKAGGPLMNVDKVGTDRDATTAHVAWFCEKGEVRWGVFPVDCLVVQNPPKGTDLATLGV